MQESDKILALFDFDGTITTKDTFLEFIKFSRTSIYFYIGFILLSPVLILYKIKVLSNSFAKQAVISFFYRGVKEHKMIAWGEEFCDKKLPAMIREKAMQKIQWHKEKGHRVIIVSASVDWWIKPWCRAMGIELISTRLELTKKRKVTGRLATPNCYGQEKVNRIKEYITINEYSYIYAYGDSEGDKQMLEIANEKGYRVF